MWHWNDISLKRFIHSRVHLRFVYSVLCQTEWVSMDMLKMKIHTRPSYPTLFSFGAIDY